MSRVKELAAKINEANAEGGLPDEQWNLLLLTDMAKSLATIVDALSEGKGAAHENQND